uniref:Uncharacterized protein n=1 Tax=Ochrobactrum phage ORM_20 TaxID=2985243 RepID=A0A9N6ZF45_9VIRU|nr:hypothetical protein ORM20_00232 [Ochrobactrum phage ORM_20]
MTGFQRFANFAFRFFIPPVLFIFLLSKSNKDLSAEMVIFFPIFWIAVTQLLKFSFFPSKKRYEKKIMKELAAQEENDMVKAYRERKKKA